MDKLAEYFQKTGFIKEQAIEIASCFTFKELAKGDYFFSGVAPVSNGKRQGASRSWIRIMRSCLSLYYIDYLADTTVVLI